MQTIQQLAEGLSALSDRQASSALNWLFGYLRRQLETDSELLDAWDKALEWGNGWEKQ